MPVKNCKTCGRQFHAEASEHWKTLCLTCYKETRRREETLDWEASYAYPRTDGARQQESSTVKNLKLRVLHLQKEKEDLTAQVRSLQQREPDGDVPAEMLKFMLMSCHPDRHSNSPQSNTVTRWLLEQRRRRK